VKKTSKQNIKINKKTQRGLVDQVSLPLSSTSNMIIYTTPRSIH